MSVLSVTSQQCLSCNSTISQERSLGIELHRQSAPKMDTLKKQLVHCESELFPLKNKKLCGSKKKNHCEVLFNCSISIANWKRFTWYQY